MKRGQQFPVSKFSLKAINILAKHPGLTAQGFAAICFPSWQKAGWLGALHLIPLVRNKLVRVRWEPPRVSPVKPKKKYYLSSLGFSVHECYRRQGYSENGDPPDTA